MVDSLCILQINTVDSGGGAAKVARDLHEAYKQKGHESWMVVGSKLADAPFIRELDNNIYRSGLPGLTAKVWKPIRKYAPKWTDLRLSQYRSVLAVDYRRVKNHLMGFEDFEFPGTAHLLDLIPQKPEVIQIHNMHGSYFDLRELATFNRQVPIVLTLHDAWLLSGHCAHSFDCQRWKTGCGKCPDLTIPPSIRRDATAFNWQRKRDIFSKSRFYIVTPSQWLMEKVEKSILISAATEARIIPNGVDLSVFQPADKKSARTTISAQKDIKLILFAAAYVRKNIFKDFQTMRTAIVRISEHFHGQNIIFIVLGEDAPPERIGRAEIRFVPYQNDPQIVARYFQAADVYIHAAHAEAWGLSITEALACGTPVVATAVGGIPEQITDGETGFLVPPGDAQAMAIRIEKLLNDEDLRQKMGQAAAEMARRRFNLQDSADNYLQWFESIRRKTIEQEKKMEDVK